MKTTKANLGAVVERWLKLRGEAEDAWKRGFDEAKAERLSDGADAAMEQAAALVRGAGGRLREGGWEAWTAEDGTLSAKRVPLEECEGYFAALSWD
jgi:hypothetical protein